MATPINVKSFSFTVDIEVHKKYVKSTKAMFKAAVLDLHNQVGGIKVKIKAVKKEVCCNKVADELKALKAKLAANKATKTAPKQTVKKAAPKKTAATKGAKK